MSRSEQRRKVLGHVTRPVVRTPARAPAARRLRRCSGARGPALRVPHPRRPGEGLAGRLLDLALAWCREHAVDQVILWPSEKSRPLYARHGFAVSKGVLVAPISDR